MLCSVSTFSVTYLYCVLFDTSIKFRVYLKESFKLKKRNIVTTIVSLISFSTLLSLSMVPSSLC